jgi:hypothetical protein
MAELLGALSYVGDNEDRAIEWAKHVDHRRTYPPRVNDGIEAIVAALGITGSDADVLRDQLKRVYTSLCMAKHANPLLSMEQGMRILEGDAYFVRGPDASRLGMKNSCFALVHATGFGLTGVYVFAKRRYDAVSRAELQNQSLKLWAQLRSLETGLAGMVGPAPIQ